jgi:hypothetical protein
VAIPLEPLAFGLLNGELLENFFCERGDGCVVLGGRDAGALVGFLVHSDCDIAHTFP